MENQPAGKKGREWHRLVPVGLALLAIVLTSPALRAGLVGDDYFHRMVLLGRGELGARLNPTRDLFSFVPDSERRILMDVGILPWWCDPGLRIALGRPVSALTHQADYALWPDSFVMQHLHSLVWFGLGVGLVAAIYRRVHGATAAAGLAGLFFAVEDAHAFPAAWLANRNALVCLVGGATVILLHLAWHKTGKRGYFLAALVTLAVALGAGEATLGALAYVAAWQITAERRAWLERLAPLVPYGAVVVIWRLLYGRAGYGTQGSALYLDPGRQPLGFLAALPERWPLLVAAQWFQAPVDLWLMLSRERQWAAAALAAALVALLLAVLWDLLQKERLARFWLLGMGLSLIPVCAAFPMDRLMVFAGIGAFGALALLLQDVGVWPWSRPGKGWRRRAALVLLGLHLPVAAILLVGRTAVLPLFGVFFADGARQSPSGPEVAQQTLVFVNGNDFPVGYTWMIRQVETPASSPRRVAQLSSALTHSLVYREDPQTLLVTSEGGFLADQLDRLLASPTRLFTEGEEIERPDYVAEIRGVTADGRPRQVAFRFQRVLEHPAYRWLHWEHGRVLEFPLPPVGESVSVEGGLFG
jgi:hypothetical protein